MKRNDIDDLTPYQKRKKNSTLKNTNKRAPKANDEDANLVDEPIGHESEVAPKKKKTSSTKKTSKPKKTEEPKAESKDGDPVIEGVTGHESGHESVLESAPKKRTKIEGEIVKAEEPKEVKSTKATRAKKEPAAPKKSKAKKADYRVG